MSNVLKPTRVFCWTDASVFLEFRKIRGHSRSSAGWRGGTFGINWDFTLRKRVEPPCFVLSPVQITPSAVPDVKHLPDASTAEQQSRYSHVAPISHR